MAHTSVIVEEDLTAGCQLSNLKIPRLGASALFHVKLVNSVHQIGEFCYGNSSTADFLYFYGL